MGRAQQSFEGIRKRACDRTLEFLHSRPEGVLLADVRAFWRVLGSAGMADNVIAWLEQDGTVVWERATNFVFLTDTAGEGAPDASTTRAINKLTPHKGLEEPE
jgi:hypothetical protein